MAMKMENEQLIWYGHVQRMKEERLPEKTMKWQPKERRKRGRMIPGWNNRIIRTMIEWKLPPEGWENTRRMEENIRHWKTEVMVKKWKKNKDLLKAQNVEKTLKYMLQSNSRQPLIL
ncbi:hypothetical protein L798_04855 [Zootermopsis nevadensis]|uniref:Endonuclease-reverse transcriptase n=1 Tax=Zootermopsis nevadensis TaxID=136037 RepID=A0A067RCP2_ZOONE|nr:hypothetical protein L798_04855 [Zootermopsis nevadensis]